MPGRSRSLLAAWAGWSVMVQERRAVRLESAALTVAGLLALALTAAVLVGYATQGASAARRLQRAGDRLRSPSHASVLMVLTDSAWESRAGWPLQVGRWVSERTKRPLLVRQWSVDTGHYSVLERPGASGRAPVELLVVDASHLALHGVLDHEDSFFPVRTAPDVVFFDLGREDPAGRIDAPLSKLASDVRRRYFSTYEVFVDPPVTGVDTGGTDLSHHDAVEELARTLRLTLIDLQTAPARVTSGQEGSSAAADQALAVEETLAWWIP